MLAALIGSIREIDVAWAFLVSRPPRQSAGTAITPPPEPKNPFAKPIAAAIADKRVFFIKPPKQKNFPWDTKSVPDGKRIITVKTWIKNNNRPVVAW